MINELETINFSTPTLSNRIYYEITSECNLKCAHCSDLLKTSKSKYLPSDKLLEFNNKMVKLGINSVVVTGGEPSLHRDFYELVESLALNCQVLITSNGTLLDFSKISNLLESNPNVTLQLSMDGISKENFEQVRGKNVYDKVIKLIDFLVSKNLNSQIGLSMTILEQNKDDVKKIISFAKKNNLKFVHFPALLPVGVAKRKWDEIAPSVKNQVAIEDYLLNELTNSNSETTISSNRIDQIITRISYKENGDCLKNMTLKITPEGYILPCPAASDPNTKVGSIDEIDICDSLIDRLNKHLNSYSKLMGTKLSNCNECDAYKYCLSRFCSNCGILTSPNEKFAEHDCSILRYHYLNALKEIED